MKVVIECTAKEITDLLSLMQNNQKNEKITFFEFDKIRKNMEKAAELVAKQSMDKINEAMKKSKEMKTYLITLSDCFGTRRNAVVRAKSKIEACYTIHADDGEFVTECCELN